MKSFINKYVHPSSLLDEVCMKDRTVFREKKIENKNIVFFEYCRELYDQETLFNIYNASKKG